MTPLTDEEIGEFSMRAGNGAEGLRRLVRMVSAEMARRAAKEARMCAIKLEQGGSAFDKWAEGAKYVATTLESEARKL